MPRPGGFQPMKRGQRKLAPGPQTQAMTRGRAVGQGKVLAQAMKNAGQAKDKLQKAGPTARIGVPKKAPQSGALKQLLAQRDQQMQKKSKVGRMPKRKKSLIPPQSAL